MSSGDDTAVEVYVSRQKSRPFLGVKLQPFTLGVRDGQGLLPERGSLPVWRKPGECPPLDKILPMKERGRRGRPADPQKAEKMEWIAVHLEDCRKRGEEVSYARLAQRLNSVPEFKDNPTSETTLRKDWVPALEVVKMPKGEGRREMKRDTGKAK